MHPRRDASFLVVKLGDLSVDIKIGTADWFDARLQEVLKSAESDNRCRAQEVFEDSKNLQSARLSCSLFKELVSAGSARAVYRFFVEEFKPLSRSGSIRLVLVELLAQSTKSHLRDR